MTKKEAYQVLDNVVSKLSLNRQDHNVLITALQTLAAPEPSQGPQIVKEAKDEAKTAEP